jgi:RNA polymerase-binding transcription factor DksA
MFNLSSVRLGSLSENGYYIGAGVPFSFVLYEQVGSLKDDLMEMQRELDRMFKERRKQDREWKEELEGWAQEVATQNELLEQSISMWTTAEEQMTGVVDNLDAIFNACGASNAPIIRLLGRLGSQFPSKDQRSTVCKLISRTTASYILRYIYLKLFRK